LALLGADVTLTDMDVEKAIPNVEANITCEEVKSRIQIAIMDWLSPDLHRFAVPFDIIVAGDCCYEPVVIEPLLLTMWNVSCRSTEIYLCGIVGPLALVAFNAVVGKYFDVERLARSEDHKASSAPVYPGGAEERTHANSDDPKTRLRALMRLHRRDSIGPDVPPLPTPQSSQAPLDSQDASQLDGVKVKSVGDIVIHGPVMLLGELEVHVCRCPRLFMRELSHVFPQLPEGPLLAIPTCQHSVVDLVKIGGAVEVEKDRCLEVFMSFAETVCKRLRSKGFWADYIDPCSGLPMITPDTTKVYSEVDGIQTLLGFATMDAGMCKILLHPKWGSSVYPASAFTNATLEVITECL